MRTIITLSDMPFCIGAFPVSQNPDSIPSTYPFEMCINTEIGRLEQADSDALGEILHSVYSLGIEMGTPSDDTEGGFPYVNDFFLFIEKCVADKGRVLEIGAGTGFLSRP